MALLKVRDECTKLIGHRFLNSHICLVISLLQLLVCCWAIVQHANSYIIYDKILRCDFLEGTLPLDAVDAVIFDFRLLHNLWGIRSCVAEYLDGGYGRLMWCVSHSTSLIFSIPAAFLAHPKPCYFWPLLVQQSAYGVCLLVLLLAALPRIVVVLATPQAAPIAPIIFYFIGTGLNFFHLYVYWHWYWHVTSMWNSAVRVRFGQRLLNANNRSRRDKPHIPTEEIDDAVLHYVPGVDDKEPRIILPPSPSTNDPSPEPSSPSKRRRRRSSAAATNNSSARSLIPPTMSNQPASSSDSRRAVLYSSDDDGDDADIDDEAPSPAPPAPIYATRLTPDSLENRRVFYDGNRQIYYTPHQPRRPRRLLPPTPNLPMHGELPRRDLPSHTFFNLPHAHV